VTASNKGNAASVRPYMTLEELANTPPIPATEEMPPELENILRVNSGVYIRSKSKPTVGIATEEVPGHPGFGVSSAARPMRMANS